MFATYTHEKTLKPSTLSLFILFALLLIGVSTTVGWLFIPKWYEIFGALLWMLIAIPCHYFGKNEKNFYFASFLFNSIGTGWAISAYYSGTKLSVDLIALLISSAYAVGIFYLFSVLSRKWGNKKYFFTVENIFWIGLLFVHFVLWIDKGLMMYSYGFFVLLIAWIYRIVDGSKSRKKYLAIRNLSYGSFGVIIAVILVIIFILSDGDVVFDGTSDGAAVVGNKKQEDEEQEEGLIE